MRAATFAREDALRKLGARMDGAPANAKRRFLGLSGAQAEMPRPPTPMEDDATEVEKIPLEGRAHQLLEISRLLRYSFWRYIVALAHSVMRSRNLV